MNIRESIDPNNTLPQVNLEPVKMQEWTGLLREKMDIKIGSAIVGNCELVTQTQPYGNKVHFDGIEIEEEARGQGIGLSAYVSAIEIAHSRGLPFETQDYDQTIHAKKIWETLRKHDVAVEIEPFRESSMHEGRFEGKYQVPVNQQ